MFSPLCSSLPLAVYQNQPPSLLDTQLFIPPIRIKKFHRIRIQYIAHYTYILNFPNVSKSPSFLTRSHALYVSPENVDDNYNVLIYKTNPIIQSIDSSTFGHWLQSCSNTDEVRKMHALVVKSMRYPVVYVNNNLISVYVKFGDFVSARGVFDYMLERNVVSWTAMLNGYQRYGINDEALRLYCEFVTSGFLGNSKTFVCVLNLCSKTFGYELGRQLHGCLIKSQLGSLILNSAILHFYAQCGDLDDAFHVFDGMERRDVICWTSIITAYSQHRRGQEAFAMFSRMISDGLDPNEYTVSSLLNACGEEQALKFGRQLHGTIVKNSYDTDVYVETSLVDMYAKCGEIMNSRTLFDGMKWKNAVTWTSIIAGYARNGHGEDAIRLFRMMGRLKAFANNLTMVSILRACGLLCALSLGKEVHAQIFKTFSPSNIFIGSALVWLYCKCGDYASASKVLQYLPDKDVVSWTAMISGCSLLGHEHEALEYLKEMLGDGVEPNPHTYSSALKACAKLENINQGRLIHSSINKSPELSNVFVGSALVHMYSKCGYLSDAVQVFDSMPEKNLVSWKSMIVAYARKGVCGEALKLVYQMQTEGIEVDDYILSTVLSSCGEFERDKYLSLQHCLQS
ncbi:pentatricopeptide repeat-containing protein At4g18520, chloroplastic-like [Primulina huaijiensis]|uniref:pentatricopeptide repeat-containing protein At4g18520, chloroplastic-like n=1 Tax=Primulina huaijiensis TaxID=1492673 RepID=UPI003CC7843B